MQWSTRSFPKSSLVIEFVAYGTAIRVGERSSPLVDPDVLVMLNDNDKGPRRDVLRDSTFARTYSNSELSG